MRLKLEVSLKLLSLLNLRGRENSMRILLLKILNWLQEVIYSWELALRHEELVANAVSFDITAVDPEILKDIEAQDEQWLELGAQQMYSRYNNETMNS